MNRTLWMVAIVGTLGLGSLFGMQGHPVAVASGQNMTMPGMSRLSGTVEAPGPFKAAQIYARNTDRDILFMVYTSGGKYHAVNLFPGNYEVRVQEKGFTSDVKKVVLRPGAHLILDFSLRMDPSQDEVPSVSYDNLYPQARGRELAEKTCIICHGAGFLPRHHWDESQWNSAIGRMSDPTSPRITPGLLEASDRRELAAYLARNFGPDSPKRILDVGAEMPLDEQALGKAMYVEYYLPPLPDKGDRLLHDPHFDQEGNVWYTDRGGDRIGKLDPRTGAWKDYAIPDPRAFPHGLTVDSEGYPWWVGNRDLGRIDPKTGKMDIYPIDPTGRREFHGHTVVVDSKKNVWFTNIIENKLGKWDFETKKITLWEAPSQNAYPYGVVVDKNDKIWMAEWIRCKFTKFDPVTETFTEYSPPSGPCVLKRLRLDSQGMIWFADGVFRAGKLGRMDPHTGKMVEYTLPMPFANPYDVSPDGKGSIWMGDDSNLNEVPNGMYFDTALIRFDQEMQNFTYYPSPQRTAMPKIEITRDGAIWYCARDAKRQALDVLYPDMTKMKTMGAFY
jgi:virginiamycin B lyase